MIFALTLPTVLRVIAFSRADGRRISQSTPIMSSDAISFVPGKPASEVVVALCFSAAGISIPLAE
jgi:hypothetical protein